MSENDRTIKYTISEILKNTKSKFAFKTVQLYFYSQIKRVNGPTGVNGLHALHHLDMDIKPEPAIATTQHTSSMEYHVLNLKWKRNLVAVVSSFAENFDNKCKNRRCFYVGL